MRKVFAFTAGLAIFCLGFFGRAGWKAWMQPSDGERLFAKAAKERPFVIVISSRNNAAWCEKNLNSVFEQKYENYRVIFIDDASSDGTAEKVEEFLLSSPHSTKVELIRNKVCQGSAANLYLALRGCESCEVVVPLDGGDWLAHDRVLEKLNDIYADGSIWLTYGNTIRYPSYKVEGRLEPLSVKAMQHLRDKPWKGCRQRSFYAGLAKRVKLQDLLLQGKFYEAAYDPAFTIPMLEMARERAFFVKEIFCVDNRHEGRKPQASRHVFAEHMKTLAPYPPLAENFEAPEGFKADLVAFSFDRPAQLYALLESVEKYVSGISSTAVICRASSDEFQSGYDIVKARFPKVRFMMQGERPKEDFKPLVLEAVFGSSSPYVVFAVDDIIVKDSVDMLACTKALQETGAYGFFLRLGRRVDHCYMLNKTTGVPPLIDVGSGIFAWAFETGEADWKYPNSVDLTVYKKSDIEPRIRKVKYENPNTFELHWMAKIDPKKVGLCFDASKMVNIPLNLVNLWANRCMHSYGTKELLEKFKAGLKIDISPLHQIENRSPHIEYEIAFVPR